MPSPNKLSIAKASIQASTKGDEPLAHLLRNVADGMFGEEPKGIEDLIEGAGYELMAPLDMTPGAINWLRKK